MIRNTINEALEYILNKSEDILCEADKQPFIKYDIRNNQQKIYCNSKNYEEETDFTPGDALKRLGDIAYDNNLLFYYKDGNYYIQNKSEQIVGVMSEKDMKDEINSALKKSRDIYDNVINGNHTKKHSSGRPGYNLNRMMKTTIEHMMTQYYRQKYDSDFESGKITIEGEINKILSQYVIDEETHKELYKLALKNICSETPYIVAKTIRNYEKPEY